MATRKKGEHKKSALQNISYLMSHILTNECKNIKWKICDDLNHHEIKGEKENFDLLLDTRSKKTLLSSSMSLKFFFFSHIDTVID